MATVRSVSKPVYNVAKLKNAAFDLSRATTLDLENCQPTQNFENPFYVFYYYSRQGVPLTALLKILNYDSNDFSEENKKKHNELVYYIWQKHQEILIKAFQRPFTSSQCWNALVKFAEKDASLADSIFRQVSKSKLFIQHKFRQQLSAELTGTPESSGKSHIINTALRDDVKFVKNTLRWAYELKLIGGDIPGKSELTLKRLNELEAQKNLLDNIRNGVISEAGVESYLKWARSPYRVFDRIVFAILGPSRFDQTNSPYPPGKTFVDQVKAALDARKQNLYQTIVEDEKEKLQPDSDDPAGQPELNSDLSIEASPAVENILPEQNVIQEQKIAVRPAKLRATENIKLYDIKQVVIENKSIKKYLNWMTSPFHMLSTIVPVAVAKLNLTVASFAQAVSDRFKSAAKPTVKLIAYKTEVTQEDLPVNIMATPVKQAQNTLTPLSGLHRSVEMGTPISDLGRSPETIGTPVSELGRSLEMTTPVSDLGRSPEMIGTPVSELGRSLEMSTPISNLGRSPEAFGTPVSDLGRSPQSIYSPSSESTQSTSSEDSFSSECYIINQIKTASGEVLSVKHNPGTGEIYFRSAKDILLYSGKYDFKTQTIMLDKHNDQTFHVATYEIDGTEVVIKPALGPNPRVQECNDTDNLLVSPYPKIAVDSSSTPIEDLGRTPPSSDHHTMSAKAIKTQLNNTPKKPVAAGSSPRKPPLSRNLMAEFNNTISPSGSHSVTKNRYSQSTIKSMNENQDFNSSSVPEVMVGQK